MKQRFKEISAYLLLALFASYYVSTSFFLHTHVVDGKTVVHSHFYFPSTENKAPSHQHSIHAFGAISFLSHFFFTGLFLPSRYMFSTDIYIIINTERTAIPILSRYLFGQMVCGLLL
jgi:hypothetical protein